jgi:hypothetical protein
MAHRGVRVAVGNHARLVRNERVRTIQNYPVRAVIVQ